MSVDLEAVRERYLMAARLPTGYLSSIDRNAATLAASAADVLDLLVEVDRLTKELAEEKQSHEQTVENFGDWIDEHQARSFRIDPPTHTTGWVWNCLACPANGSFAREADAFGWATAHEMRTHGAGRGTEAARAEQ